ncbi:transcription antitermination protein NusB [Bacteriovoracaceae bacterium]|nr:transcription antitermination protein NusB [Bacteriovoracaceae bacterium]
MSNNQLDKEFTHHFNEECFFLCAQFLYQFQLPIFQEVIERFSTFTEPSSTESELEDLKLSFQDFLYLKGVDLEEFLQKNILLLFFYTLRNTKTINQQVAKVSSSESKINKVDFAIISLAKTLAEVSALDRTQVINYAINSSKKFGHEKNYKFVNAICDKII